MCFSVFMMYLHTNNILSTPLYSQNHCTKNSLVFSLFLSPKKKTGMTPCFHKDFWEIKVLIQKPKIKLVFVLIIKFWKFKWYPNTYKKPERQPEHHEITSKLSFDCMNNEKPFCIFVCEKAKLVDSNCMHLKWRKAIFFIILSQC
jgi:hypothetical protein